MRGKSGAAEISAWSMVNRLDPDLQPMTQNRANTTAVVQKTLDRVMHIPSQLSEVLVDQLLEFLEALTLPLIAYLVDQTPKYVPSGLPVVD